MRPLARPVALFLTIYTTAINAGAGPETALREYAGNQVKKGVRTIAMGGDGATTGNYALVYNDAGTAIVDEGVVHFTDTGNLFTFGAVGVTTPSFWKGAALYLIALRQNANNARVWDFTAPSALKPPSRGQLADTAAFLKFAKPITRWFSVGLMAGYEVSEATLVPEGGGPTIQYRTAFVPSGGLGLHWHPDEHWQLGLRVILNRDQETRTQGATSSTGQLRSYEYRLGGAYSPWRGTLVDVGVVALDRSNAVEHTSTFWLYPTVGVEQALVPKRVWMRAGLDETTWTTGMGVTFGPIKVDLAYLYNLAAVRTADVFGKRNASLIGTIGLDYGSFFTN